MLFLLQPLLQKYYDKHRRHNKIKSLSVERNERTEDSADGCAGNPIALVKKRNGKIKFPDGKVIIPRREYDANLVYDRKIDEKAKLDAMYNKILKKKKVNAQKQGIYQKIKQYESRVRRN